MKADVNGAEAMPKSTTGQLLVVPGGVEGHPPENGSHSCSSSNSENAGQNANGTVHKTDLDYLGQLLKDKKQLAAFPNVFTHVERLVDEEINRIRVNIFQCEFNREPMQLPEPVGDVVILQEKVFVPVQQYPDYNFVGRILGPRGMTAKQLEAETGCKIMVRGRGSMRDKKKEDMNRGKPNWEHLNEELHVIIQCEDTPNRNAVKMARAAEEVRRLLVPQPEGEDELKRKQLMELAIINGTFRNDGTPTGQLQSGKGAAASLLQLDQQRLLLGSTASLASPMAAGLAGAPLILSSGQFNPMSLATAQPLAATSLAQQTLLQQLSTGTPNGILATPGPYGLLPQTSVAALGNGQLDLLALSAQLQSQQQQQFDSTQLSALLQQQQLALLQQGNGLALGEYSTTNVGADNTGAILSGQRRFVGHSRDGAHPYGVQPAGKQNR